MASPPQKILLLFAHPALEKSRVHRRLVRAAQGVEGVTFHDLYEEYPDFDVDVAREQELLETHDFYVLQHPFYWYSTPPLVKQWLDLVLEHGWAYGQEGTALRGKPLLSVVTAGGGEASYTKDGLNRHTVRELLAPLEQTLLLCGIDYLPPFVLHGTHDMNERDITRTGDEYARVLAALRDGRVDLAKARELPRFNADLATLLGS